MTNPKHEIAIDMAALEKKMAEDPILLGYAEEFNEQDKRQAEKRVKFTRLIDEKRAEIKKLQKDAGVIRRKIKVARGHIGRYKAFSKIRGDVYRRIERRIKARKRFLKQMEVRKAIALARQKVRGLLHL
jgi:cell fate (sporulation/competence/biofilm development) regulator YmcA (YheA/YmcA/DUF963 family)